MDIRRETIHREGRAPAALAIAGDRIAVGDADGRVELFSRNGAGPLAAWDGIGPGQQISIAPSGTAVLLRSAALLRGLPGDVLELRRAGDGISWPVWAKR